MSKSVGARTGGVGVIRKSDKALQIVYAEVYVPNVPDSQGEFMTIEEVRKAAHLFMTSADTDHCVDINHDGKVVKCEVVESFIARDGDTDFIPHSWVAGVHITDPAVWDKVQKGELNGFSLEAEATAFDATLEVDLPEEVRGLTQKSEDHEHAYTVVLDDQGQIVRGETNWVNGHTHLIKRGTITEVTDGHRHRFSMLDALLAGAA